MVLSGAITMNMTLPSKLGGDSTFPMSDKSF
jgi:hypothetical protein